MRPANHILCACCLQVICEVYATQTSVRIAPHVMLSLILYKMVDEARDVSTAIILSSLKCQPVCMHYHFST